MNIKTLVIMVLTIMMVSSQSFSTSKDDEAKPKETGLVDCLQSCETEYSQCNKRTDGSFLCDLQSAKCSLKCAVAKEDIGENIDGESIIVTIQQKSNMRYLDAHESADKDYRLVTRTRQNNATQKWKITPLGNNTFTLRQVSNGRFVDAHEYSKKDFGLVTRTNQKNNTQRWIIKGVGGNLFTIQQKSNRRYMDAHVTANRDYEVVTRPFQENNTQRWLIKPTNKINFSRLKRKAKESEVVK